MQFSNASNHDNDGEQDSEGVEEGTYQIGPYKVTPGDDASGLMAYVVRMQEGLNEAIQALHNNEVKVNQLSNQVSQLGEEKAHAMSKLNVVTRTAQDRDQQCRKARAELAKVKREQEELEKTGPHKATAEARKKLKETKAQLQTCRGEIKELKAKVSSLEKEQKAACMKVVALEEDLEVSTGRHESLEEQRQAAQEQVHALNWKLQAFEGQYAALYQQYALQTQTTVQDQSQPEILHLPPSIDDQSTEENMHLLTNISSTKEDILSTCSTVSTLPPQSSSSNIRKGELVPIRGVKVRKSIGNLPTWIPERWANRLYIRSIPRIRLLLTAYMIILHILLIFWLYHLIIPTDPRLTE